MPDPGAKLRKRMLVSWALTGASALLALGLCGPVASRLDPPGHPTQVGPTGFFGELGLVFVVAALVLAVVALGLTVAWAFKT